MEKVQITLVNFKGTKTQVSLRKGMGLVKLRDCSPELEFDCLKGDCGICIVKVQRGFESLSPCTQVESDFLNAMHAEPNERLACQCRAFGPVELEIENFNP